MTLFAGHTGGTGNADGTGAAARFNRPGGIATDSAGNVYVADTDNQIIRKITFTGAVTTLAGRAGVPGSINGAGTAAHFSFPHSLTIDSIGNVFVADTSNRTIRKITPAGGVTTFAGAPLMSGSVDGTGAAARFIGPRGIAADSSDNLYVADTFNHTIRKITPAGVVTTLAGTAGMVGSIDGTGAVARFNLPRGVATDSAGNIYVADSSNYTIRLITPAGIVTTLAGTAGIAGDADGTGAAARFNSPLGVTIDSAGNVYVADTLNYAIRMITPAGVVTTLAGRANSDGSTDGTGAAARFTQPEGVAADSRGNVYVADTGNSIIRKVTLAGVVTTFSGEDGLTGSADGTGPAARFTFPEGIATDSAANVYVADTRNNTIRKITPAGVVTTPAGSHSVIGDYVDGTGDTARFNSPKGIATDRAGNVYVADTGNDTIRKITPAGVVTSLAGAGVIGSADGTGAAASFRAPSGVATDSAGNVYVADTDNHTVRRITPAGVVTTLAGLATLVGSIDGTGAAARFNLPHGIAIDSAGNVYVADSGNHSIRRITPAGIVTTFAGMAGTAGSLDATGAAARFRFPQGIAIDSADNVYVADDFNHTIRKITPMGSVSTIVGVAGQSSFVPGALPGLLRNPAGVAVTGSLLYITLYNGVAVVQNRP